MVRRRRPVVKPAVFVGLPGSTFYVATTGSDTNPGTSGQPFATIGRADSVAVPGTTVYVLPGTYTGDIHTTHSGNASGRIQFISQTRWGAKIVPGTTATMWDSRGQYVDIVGFEFDGTGSTTTREGLYVAGSYSSARSNHVHHVATATPCTSTGGDAIGTDSFYNGYFIDVIGNVVHDIGYPACNFIQGIYISTSGKVLNNIAYNIGYVAIHLWHDANAVDIVNNTVHNATHGILVGSGDYYHTTGPVDFCNVANNIISTVTTGIDEEGSTGTHNTYNNNLVYNATTPWALLTSTHSGDVTGDPRFVNAAGGDFHLAQGSPAIDSGLSATYVPTTDLDGKGRPQGSGVDLGAFETSPPLLWRRAHHIRNYRR